MKTQIKIFSGFSRETVEKNANEFMATVKVTSVLFRTTFCSFEMNTTVLIVYEVAA